MWTRLLELVARLSALRSAARLDEEFRSEIEAHLELLTEEYERRGMTPDEAHHRARLKLGGTAQLLRERREQRGFPGLEAFVIDVRFGLRLLRKSPGFTAAALLALALGMGATNTVFTFVNAVTLRGLPVDEPDRIVALRPSDRMGRPRALSYREFLAYRAASKSVADLAAFRRAGATVRDDAMAPDYLQSLFISWNGFRVLGVESILGRVLLSEDDRIGSPSVVVLGFHTWKNRYRGEPSILGRTIHVDGAPAVVVGVMPEGFRFDYWAELWQPLAHMPGLLDEPEKPVLQAFGRLADGASLSRAQAEIDTIAGSSDSGELAAQVRPFTGSLSSDPALLSLLAAVGFVLLIACANVANLLLARSSRRSQEVVTRVALGASRLRIVRQLLTESAVLAALAGLGGFALSVLGLRLLTGTIANVAKPYWIDWSMDGRVFAVFFVVCLVTTFLVSLAPALSLSRVTEEPGRQRSWSSGLLVAEVSLTLALLASAGSLLTSFLGLVRLDENVATAQLTTMALRLPEGKYATLEEGRAFFERLEERLSGLAPISSFTFASTVPFAGAPTVELELEGGPRVDSEEGPTASVVFVDSRYFETLGLRLRRGRSFTELDGTPGHDNVIVNQLFAAAYFPGESPMGRRIRIEGEGGGDWLTVVGISETVRQRTLQAANPVVYRSYRAAPRAISRLIVGTEGDPAPAIALLRDEVRAVDSDIPVHGIMAMDELLSQSRWPHRVYGVAFGLFALVALVLSGIGLYAVTSYLVAARTREIGLRVALGATPSAILWLVSRRVVLEVGLGLALGVVAALGLLTLLSTFLIQTDAHDPARLALAVGLLAVLSAAAALTAMRNATGRDPAMALRHE